MQVSEFKSNGQKALPIKHSKDNVSKSFTLGPSLKYVTEIRITDISYDIWVFFVFTKGGFLKIDFVVR